MEQVVHEPVLPEGPGKVEHTVSSHHLWVTLPSRIGIGGSPPSTFKKPRSPRWVFEQHKTVKESGGPLVVLLKPTPVALPALLIAPRPEGPLFLNNKANPWTDTAIGKGGGRVEGGVQKEGHQVVQHRQHVRLPAHLPQRSW